MKHIIFITFLLLIPLAFADTTFFDNPDETFIMGSSPTGGVIIEETTGGAISGTTSGGSCLYKWNCTNWNECLPSGKQKRNCVNIGTCLDTYKAPSTEQNCNYTASDSDEEKKENKEIAEKNKLFSYFIIILIILFIIFYLKKDYFKKLIKKAIHKNFIISFSLNK
jgi:hypothetical protein